MTSLYKVIALDAQEYSNLNESTIRLWRDGGRIDEESLLAPEGTQEWRPLREVFDIQSWPVPPAPAPRSAPPVIPEAPKPPRQLQAPPTSIQPAPLIILEPVPELAIPGERPAGSNWDAACQKVSAWDFILIGVLGVLIFCVYYFGSGTRPPFQSAGVFFAGILLLSGVYLLFRLRFSRVKSFLGCGGALVLLLFIGGVIAGVWGGIRSGMEARKRNAEALHAKHAIPVTSSLAPQPAGGLLTMLAPQPFLVEGQFTGTDASLASRTTFHSVSQKVSIFVNYFRYNSGYRFMPEQALKSVIENYEKEQTGISLISGPYRTVVAGRSAMRADLKVSSKIDPLKSIGSISVVAYSYPDNLSAPQTGTIIAIVTEYRDELKEKEETERMLESISLIPAETKSPKRSR